MLQTLKCYLQALCYPKWRDYIVMGQGIDRRSKHARTYWKKHLDLSKEFQTRSIEESSKNLNIAVLGAGRLLDVDQEYLRNNFKRIEFFDANPLVQNTWDKFSKTLSKSQVFKGHHIDLTNSINSWTEELELLLKSAKTRDLVGLEKFLKNLRCIDRDNFLNSFDSIVSLNLLSQIPIYWRDRVHTLVKRHWKIDTDENGYYALSLQNALNQSMHVLQTQHLALLSMSSAKTIILITDSEFMYYLKDHSHWQCEPALFLSKELELPNYKIGHQDCWFWHIAPQGLETSEYGVIHNVIAKTFQMSS